MMAHAHNDIFCKKCGIVSPLWLKKNRHHAGFASWIHMARKCCRKQYRAVTPCRVGKGKTNYVIYDPTPIMSTVAFLYEDQGYVSSSSATRYNTVEIQCLGLEIITLPGTTKSACPPANACSCFTEFLSDDTYYVANFYETDFYAAALAEMSFQVTLSSGAWNSACQCGPGTGGYPYFCTRIGGNAAPDPIIDPPDISLLHGDYGLAVTGRGDPNYPCYWKAGAFDMDEVFVRGGRAHVDTCVFDDGESTFFSGNSFELRLYYGNNEFGQPTNGFTMAITFIAPEGFRNVVFYVESELCRIGAGPISMTQTSGHDFATFTATLERVIP